MLDTAERLGAELGDEPWWLRSPDELAPPIHPELAVTLISSLLLIVGGGWLAALVAAFGAGSWMTTFDTPTNWCERIRRRCINGWAMAALVVDGTPVVGALSRRILRPALLGCLRCTRRHRRTTVYDIRQLRLGRVNEAPIPLNCDASPRVMTPKTGSSVVQSSTGDHENVAAKEVRARWAGRLGEAWTAESRVEYRDGHWQYCLRFVPRMDMVVQYSVQNSRLTQSFLAFYRQGTAAIFPPEPLDVYWDESDESSVSRARWSTGESSDEMITGVVQQAAGPRQTLGPIPAQLHDTLLEAQNEMELAGRAAHAWSPAQFLQAFPTIFALNISTPQASVLIEPAVAEPEPLAPARAESPATANHEPSPPSPPVNAGPAATENSAAANPEPSAPLMSDGSAPVTGEAPACLTGDASAPVTGEAPACLTGDASAPVTGEGSSSVTGEASAPVPSPVTGVTGETSAEDAPETQSETSSASVPDGGAMKRRVSRSAARAAARMRAALQEQQSNSGTDPDASKDRILAVERQNGEIVLLSFPPPS